MANRYRLQKDYKDTQNKRNLAYTKEIREMKKRKEYGS